MSAAMEKLKPVTDRFKGYLEVAQKEYECEDQRVYKSLQFWINTIMLVASVIGTFYFPPMFFLHLIKIFA